MTGDPVSDTAGSSRSNLLALLCPDKGHSMKSSRTSFRALAQRDNTLIAEIMSMFCLTLQDITLGWFDSEAPNLQTEDALKQAFLKRFNRWGDTRHQQQDTWTN